MDYKEYDRESWLEFLDLIDEENAINSTERNESFQEQNKSVVSTNSKPNVPNITNQSRPLTPNNSKILPSSIDSYPAHFVIDGNGNYYLLNSKLDLVDQLRSNRVENFFLRKYNLSQFKKQLKSDLKTYKSNCKKSHTTPNYDITRIYRKIKLYLFLCPDADYQILTLLRKNITKVNSNYTNYFVACAEYLDELASNVPDKSVLPFDLNYSCKGHFDDLVLGNHYNLANVFKGTNNPVTDYKNMVSNSTKISEFIDENDIEAYRGCGRSIYDRSKRISLSATKKTTAYSSNNSYTQTTQQTSYTSRATNEVSHQKANPKQSSIAPPTSSRNSDILDMFDFYDDDEVPSPNITSKPESTTNPPYRKNSDVSEILDILDVYDTIETPRNDIKPKPESSSTFPYHTDLDMYDILDILDSYDASKQPNEKPDLSR